MKRNIKIRKNRFSTVYFCGASRGIKKEIEALCYFHAMVTLISLHWKDYTHLRYEFFSDRDDLVKKFGVIVGIKGYERNMSGMLRKIDEDENDIL